MSTDNKIATMLAVSVISQSSREAVSNSEMLVGAVEAGAIELDEDETRKLRDSVYRYRTALRHLETVLPNLLPPQ